MQNIKSRLHWFILCIPALIHLPSVSSLGSEHARRHHHGILPSSPYPEWDGILHREGAIAGSSSFEDSQQDQDWGDISDPQPAVPSYNRESHSFDTLAEAQHYNDLNQERRKDLRKTPEGSLLSASSSYLNETKDRGSLTYSGSTVFDIEANRKNDEIPDYEKHRLLLLDSNEPVPAATKTRDQESIPNDYLSAPQWTLKYQGSSSEQLLNNTQTNITAPIGGSAFLPCKVGHLGDRQISWIRRRDWHVLTSGKKHYTHDGRFAVLHEPGSQDWILHIKWLDLKDAGTYECQVSTGTGIISLFINLRVVIPEAFIPGEGQYHINKGSLISLNCFIKNSPSPPQYILWHHNAELLNFLRNRPDLNIKDNLHGDRDELAFLATEESGIDDGLVASSKSDDVQRVFASRLVVAVANDSHSGNYSCSAPNTVPASTLVFITEGDKTAAVQRIHSDSCRLLPDIGVFLAVLLILGAELIMTRS